MTFSFKLQSDSDAIVDHQAKVFEKRENLRSWLILLLDSFVDPHNNLDGSFIFQPPCKSGGRYHLK